MAYRYLICNHCPALNRVPLDNLQKSPVCGKCKKPLAVDPVLSASDSTLEMAIRSSAIPVIVDFWAPWCGPCRTFAPVFQRQAEHDPSRALYLKLNTEENPQAGNRYNIQAIPTLVAFTGGREKVRQSGALNPGQLAQWVAQL